MGETYRGYIMKYRVYYTVQSQTFQDVESISGPIAASAKALQAAQDALSSADSLVFDSFVAEALKEDESGD